MRTDYQGVTPELPEVIRTIIDQVMVQMYVCLPAKIVEYDASTQYASVQIQLKKKYENGDVVAQPVIPNVPVKHPRAAGGKTYIHLPIKKDDDVMLVFSQRSLDNWKTQGGMQDPADRRKFHITDAFALIGGSSIPDAFEVNDPDSIEIQNQSGKIQVKPDGTLNLGDYAPSKSAALGEAVQARLSKLENGLTQLVADVSSFVTLYTAHVHNSPGPAILVAGTPVTSPIPPGVPPTAFTPDTSVVSSAKVKVIP